jgi:galactose-1-phosphate uridylyltransferase
MQLLGAPIRNSHKQLPEIDISQDEVQEQYHYKTFTADKNRSNLKKIVKNCDKPMLKQFLYGGQRVFIVLLTYGEFGEMLSLIIL